MKETVKKQLTEKFGFASCWLFRTYSVTPTPLGSFWEAEMIHDPDRSFKLSIYVNSSVCLLTGSGSNTHVD